MSNNGHEKGTIRFGLFELEPSRSELRKCGARLSLQHQPYEVLALLIRRQGQIVTREEIRRQIWADGTYVDFEKGINFCLRQIRAALGDDARNPEYIETIRSQGYRLLTPVNPLASDLPNFSPRKSLASPQVEFGSEQIALAVLPIDSQGKTAEEEFLAGCLTDALITDLTRTTRLSVVSRMGVMPFKGVSKPVQEIAQELNVQVVVGGEVSYSRGRIRVLANLVDARTGINLWAESCERSAQDIFTLGKDISWAFANAIKRKLLAPQNGKVQRSYAPKTEAYQLYVMGRYCWAKRTEQGLKNAIRLLERAIGQNPEYALAYSALADCYLISSLAGSIPPKEAYPKGRAAVAKALEIDNTLAEAHASLGYSKMTSEWEWQAAEEEFQRAIELDPNCSTARQWYGDYLTATGRHEEALDQINRAWELDPLSLNINADVGWALTHARRYDEAIEHYRVIVEMAPDFIKARSGLALAYLQKSMFSEAIQELRHADALTPDNPTIIAALGHIHGLCREKTEVQKLLARLEAVSNRRYVSAYEMAIFHAGSKQLERTGAWLQEAYSERSAYLVYLAADPRCEELRSEKEVYGVANRLGLVC